MEGHEDAFRFDTEVPLDLEFGDVLPPEPPEPPRRRGRGGGPGRHPADRAFFSPWVTLVAALLLAALATLQILVLHLGARGGEMAVYVAVTAFGLLFLGPFVGGALWFDRQRRA